MIFGILLGIVTSIIILNIWLRRDKWWSYLTRFLEEHTASVDNLTENRVVWCIALAAGLSLFAELLIIRFHESCFQLFGFFKNVSLLSCFLGLGIGYSRGKERLLTTPLVMPLLLIQMASMHFLRYYPSLPVFLNPNPDTLEFGMANASGLKNFSYVYGFMIMIFSFNALCFVPLGQLASRLMMRRENLIAYSWNLIGSLLGIGLFSILAYLWSPPVVWVLFMALALLYLIGKSYSNLLITAVASGFLLASLSISFDISKHDIYSPYQIITVDNGRGSITLLANNTWHQNILAVEAIDPLKDKDSSNVLEYHYPMPYYFKEKPEDVLIVGCGMGNDVAVALRHNASRIDAIEIDPVILKFGNILHPQRVFQSSKVNPVNTDARAYIKQTKKKYDLIVYGFLDSHTMLASKSGIRLDSYVYTVEAFREARSRLKMEGIISLSFSYLSDNLNQKIFDMLKEAFDGKSPLVYNTSFGNGHTFIIGENLSTANVPELLWSKNISEQFESNLIPADKATDNWPFLYMPVKKFPLYYLAMVLVLFSISSIFIFQFSPGATSGISIPCFFLGAGFMLIETKGITELALLYGSTWVVLSAVIAAILIMAFLANLLLLKINIPRPSVTYGLLLLSIIAGLQSSSLISSSFSGWSNKMAMTIMLTLPVFFGGIAFSSELKKSIPVTVALSSNLLGAMLGGFLEYNSMKYGFRSLYILALVLYGLAFLGVVFHRKTKAGKMQVGNA
ncbi:MAG: hypothetical protein A3F83_07975 [Candidatus Glassbacteria bacterium RIFCSPLOWO2_12_FULL_58_11]|uniref:PABS domain-containing protein n=1 Tax=Candidatus Glassbacteria bacterium RIFCSPLOWO2_12_FULL_58_11 TaxID=1817867 RepID=A0A1F5YQP7_9BACT|nr:MAG: hypothetical protein A3F83_07975 [Candidatus Glassbacteria bacterium RIFCSPLOWO2_12_FULL_58_11]